MLPEELKQLLIQIEAFLNASADMEYNDMPASKIEKAYFTAKYALEDAVADLTNRK